MNKLDELNNYLFTALDRLNNPDLKGEKLETEIKRAQAVGNVANQVIGTYALQLKAESMRSGAMFEHKAIEKNGAIVTPIEDLDKPRVIRDKNFYKSSSNGI